jgi:hypothetical protein
MDALEPARDSRLSVALGTESAPALIHWSTGFLPRRTGTLDSYALRTRDGWVLIDPLEPDPAVLDHLERLLGDRPIATVLTSDGHERDSPTFRERWSTPIWGPIPLESERGVGYDGEPDHLYEEGRPAELPGGLRAARVAGIWGGDHALLGRAPSGERVLAAGCDDDGTKPVELPRLLAKIEALLAPAG